MKKNIYFRTMYRRKNVLWAVILDFFLKVSSYPRLILEVFIRKNFGERYFSLASVLTVAVLLVLLPQLSDFISSFFSRPSFGYRQRETGIGFLWYMFLMLFVGFSIVRLREIDGSPSVFNFGRFSLYSGDIHPLFSKIELFGKKPSIRTIETVLEPALFFIIGMILMYLGQKLGILLMVSSILYSLSYVAAYKKGDDFVLDMIDEMIMNEELENAIVHDLPGDQTRGVRFYGEKPKPESLRKKLTESFIDQGVAEEFAVVE